MEKNKRLFRSDNWQSCFDAWIAAQSSEITRYYYRLIVQRFFECVASRYGTPRPAKITRADVTEFLHTPNTRNNNKVETLRPATMSTYCMVISSFYAFAAQYEIVYRGRNMMIFRGDSPTKGVKLPHVGPAERSMDEGDLERFFAQIDKTTLVGMRDNCLFKALISTGRRVAEMARLRRCDIEQMTFVESGQRRQGWLYHFRGKGHTAIDDYDEMPPPVMELLIAFHAAAGRDLLTMPPESPLFPGEARKQLALNPITPAIASHRFRRYATRAGMPQNIVCHSLRWEHAWQRYECNGNKILEVRDALRHKDVGTTVPYLENGRKRRRGDPIANKLAAKFAHL